MVELIGTVGGGRVVIRDDGAGRVPLIVSFDTMSDSIDVDDNGVGVVVIMRGGMKLEEKKLRVDLVIQMP